MVWEECNLDRRILINNAELIFSKDVFGYGDVLNNFNNASEINIVTFNFSDNYGELKNLIKNLDSSVVVNIVTNIPGSWNIWDGQKGKEPRTKAREMINKLDFIKYNCNVNAYINLSNHSKIIMTNNICYVGSSNYSDLSKNNYECGFIIKDANEIKNVKTIVDEIISSSLPIIGKNHINISTELKLYIKQADSIINYINNRFNYIEAKMMISSSSNSSVHDIISEQDGKQIDELLANIKTVTKFLKSKKILDSIGEKISEDLLSVTECSFMVSKHIMTGVSMYDLMNIEMLHEDIIDEFTSIKRKLEEMVVYLESMKIENFDENK